MHLTAVDLADGLGPPSEPAANRLFELLRLRNLNANTRLAATVLHEGVKVFKGEPFEQAYAYQTIAAQKGTRADWGNVRAAAYAALDLLDEFDDARYDRSSDDRGPRDRPTYAYAIQQTDFPLAYLMVAVANTAMGRSEEAADFARHAADLRKALKPLARTLTKGDYNTILIVEYGRGPIKVASGTDKVYRARTRSDNRPLIVTIDGHPAGAFPVAADLNRLADAYSWDDLRRVQIGRAHV